MKHAADSKIKSNVRRPSQKKLAARGKLTAPLRVWLTKSFQPFHFTKEHDQILPYEEGDNLGLYVHIPFCRSICRFCPYCKVVYDEQLAEAYLKALLKEIDLVGGMGPVRRGAVLGKESNMAEGPDMEAGNMAEAAHKGPKSKKAVTSLYFGGGSPALLADSLGEIIGRLKRYFIIREGIGAELHPEDVKEETLLKLKEAGVTKISIGVQSFQKESLGILGRKQPDYPALFAALKAVPFDTVSMDLIFAIPGQTGEGLKADIEQAFAGGADQIAAYPFIDFTFAENPAPPLPEREKKRLLQEIADYCREKGYVRTSIWTFAKAGGDKYSSMTREQFLGFGPSAATLLARQFKINTFSVEGYVDRIEKGLLPTGLTLRFTRRQRMVYYLFWTAYTMAVKEKDFREFFGVSLGSQYGFELLACRLLGLARKKGDAYYVTDKGAYYYHYLEQFYTLSYIDKMWNLMRKTAFPEEMFL